MFDYSPKCSSSTNSSSLTDCRLCRICGTVYQNIKNCKCTVKNYPKSVAYELSFVNGNQADVEINSIDKNIETRDASRCACNGGTQQRMRRYGYNNREAKSRKFIHKRKHTLQVILFFFCVN